MNVASLIGAIVCLILLVGVMALRIPRSQYSEFELRRRKELGDPQAIFGLKRLLALSMLLTLQHVLTLLLIVGLVLLLVSLVGWGMGVLWSMVTVLVVGPIARIGIVRRLSQRVYRRYELALIGFVGRYRPVFSGLRPPLELPGTATLPSSREELAHLLHESRGLVSSEEAILLTRSLEFYGRSVGAVMTPADEVVTIDASELLGPLVLSDLHKTGHSTFPVTNGEGKEVIGLLDITGSLGLKHHDSTYVRDQMNHDIVRIDQAEPLDEALKVLVAVKQPCLLVTGDDGEMVGLLSLGDVVRALTGWKRH